MALPTGIATEDGEVPVRFADLVVDTIDLGVEAERGDDASADPMRRAKIVEDADGIASGAPRIGARWQPDGRTKDRLN